MFTCRYNDVLDRIYGTKNERGRIDYCSGYDIMITILLILIKHGFRSDKHVK